MWNFKSTGRVKTVDSQNPNVQGNVETYRSLTQAEYDELSYEEKHSGIVYFITDGATDHIAASSIRYDNSGTHIASTSVQGAIDALDAINNEILSLFDIGNVTQPSFSLVNCTGTITHNNIYYTIKNNMIMIFGRVNIGSFVRTSNNPGISFKIQNLTLKSSVRVSCIGLSSISLREGCSLSITTDGTCSITTTESYLNAPNGTLTLQIPQLILKLSI